MNGGEQSIDVSKSQICSFKVQRVAGTWDFRRVIYFIIALVALLCGAAIYPLFRSSNLIIWSCVVFGRLYLIKNPIFVWLSGVCTDARRVEVDRL